MSGSRKKGVWFSAAAMVAVAFLAAGARAEAVGTSQQGTSRDMPAEPTGARQGLIHLEQITEDRWRLTYELAEPATRLRFARPARFFRETHWSVTTPGWRLERDGESQVLVGDAPRHELVLEMEAWAGIMQAEYRAAQPFSDGATALYTGHFYLRDVALEERVEVADDAPYLARLRVTPPPGTRAIVQGRVHDRPFEWTDPYSAGTYLYFGAQKPIVTRHLIAVVDPGLPAWLKHRAESLFPPMFEGLTQGFDEALPWQPTVLIAWEAGPEDAQNWSGGALPGQIRMSLQGGQWEMENPSNAAELARFIAHEAAHFWNGQIISYRDRNQSWMHEGGADAIAELMLLRLGLVGPQDLNARREIAINRCLSALGGLSVNGLAARNQFGDYYPCGHLMAIWSEAALAQSNPDHDLLTLWARLIDDTGVGQRYAQEDYFAVLEALGVRAVLTGAMARFASEDLPDQRQWVIDGFRSAGLSLAPGNERPPAPVRRDLARDAVTQMMAALCDGGYSLSAYADYLHVYPVGECTHFPVDADVHYIAGHPYADGDLIYDAVASACLTGGALSFQDGDGIEVLSVRCNDPIPARHDWLSLDDTDRAASSR